MRKRELEALVEEAEKQKAAKDAAKAQPGVSACLKVDFLQHKMIHNT